MQLNDKAQTACYWQRICCWYETEFKKFDLNGLGIRGKLYQNGQRRVGGLLAPQIMDHWSSMTVGHSVMKLIRKIVEYSIKAISIW